MKYVLDASVALKWVLAEPGSDRALALRADFRRGIHTFLAPDVFLAEAGHTLAKAERRKVIAPPQGSILLADLLTTIPQLRPSLPLLPQAFSIASAFRISFYDCLYVALADRESCKLLTADLRLVHVLQSQFPFITAIASI
jgi:predicted nucleic acid-binding protein